MTGQIAFKGQGWSCKNEISFDLDPECGILAGREISSAFEEVLTGKPAQAL